MKFSREIEIQKQKKLAEADFPEKFLFALGKMGRNVPKWSQNWFVFEIYNILPLLLKVALNETNFHMLLYNQIVEFYEDQYIWN